MTGPRPGGPLELTRSRPVSILMVSLAVTIFGPICLTRLPVDLMPDFTYPSITVRTDYPGTAPADVEDRISRRLEENLAVTRGLRSIESVSRAGVSDVTLEFDWQTDMKFASQDVRELLDQVVLPEDAEDPILLRYDPSQEPILRIALFGASDLAESRRLAEDEIRRELETVAGVAAVRVRGGLEPEIQIELDEAALTSRELDIGFVGDRLAAENLNLASGELVDGDTEYIVRTLTEFRDLAEIENLVLDVRDGAPLRLRDVALVRFGHAEREVITRVDGAECVLLDVYKEAEANLVRVAEDVRRRVFGTPAQRRFAASERAERNRATGDATRSDGSLADDAAESDEGEENGDRDGDDGSDSDSDGAAAKAEALAEARERARRDAMLDFVAARLPPGLELRVLSDPSRFIEASIAQVRSAAVVGGILAIAVLFVFLRRVRPTLIIATSIPVSVLATFAPMYLAGISINIMSLGGLALGIGMLVDNSIVVLESITRCREEGDGRVEAALRGVREVAGAISASTLTTVSVFFPMVFVEGVAGQIFRDQALTVVYSLLVSLVVALFLIPMLASRRFGEAAVDNRSGDGAADGDDRSIAGRPAGTGTGTGPKTDTETKTETETETETDTGAGRRRGPDPAAPFRELRDLANRTARKPVLLPVLLLALILRFPVHLFFALLGFLIERAFTVVLIAGRTGYRILGRGGGAAVGPPLRAFSAVFATVQEAYARLLARAVRHPIEIVALLIVLAAGSLWLLPRLGRELIPPLHQGEFTAEVTLAAGSPIETTSRVALELERRARALDDVADVFSVVGIEDDVVVEGEAGPHTARLHVRLTEGPDPARREDRVKAFLAEAFRGPEVRSVEFRNPTLFSFRTPIEVEIRNDDLDELRRDAERAARRIARIEGLRDVRSSVERGYPEIRVRFDREKLARFGLDQAAVQDLLRNKVRGEVPTRFSETGLDRKIDILVRVDEASIASLEDLEALVINPGEATPRRLGDVASFEVSEGPSEIRHLGLTRGALVSADLAGLDLGTVAERIEVALQDVRSDESESMYTLAGQKEEMERSLGSLRSALALAVFLVYLVMAALFESLVQPFVILLAIPLALLGVIPVLAVLGIPLGIIVFIGMIMLAGIVVNNAIVLIDAINRRRRQGLARDEAIVAGGRERFRPILMTTLTTVLGLLPLTGWLAGLGPAALGGGEGTELRAPLAITVIAGLTSSTFLTLFVVPIGYSVMTRSRKAHEPEDELEGRAATAEDADADGPRTAERPEPA